MAKQDQGKYWLHGNSIPITKAAPKIIRGSLLLLLLVSIVSNTLAQNLVPNPGFERYNNCQNFIAGVPGYPDNIVYSPGYDSFPTVQTWIATLPGSSPDYFNACDTTPYWHGVPLNDFGYQQPHSGNAYAGICMYVHQYREFDDYREYLETKLTQPLSAGHQYYISFFVNLAASFDPLLYGNVLSVDKIGVLVTDTLVHDTATLEDAYLPMSPTIETVPGWYITDTAGWTKISGYYTAHGGEQWLTLGHFRDGVQRDSLLYTISDSTYSNDSFFYCYMYMDDICVMDVNGSTHDTAFCSASFPITLQGSVDTGAYLWSTGDTTATLQAIGPGTYWRIVRAECLYHTDTFHIGEQPLQRFNTDTTLCSGPVLTLGSSQEGISYLWSTGDTACCISVSNSGMYAVTATGSCGTAANNYTVTFAPCDHCMGVPNAFTPNNDGLNDNFKITPRCGLKDYRINIYNRWGQLIFTSADVHDSWNGTFNNTPQDMGVYCYYIRYTTDDPGKNTEQILKGNIQLLR